MTRAMDAYARTRGVELIDRIDFSQVRRLLDLGSGPGTCSFAIIERFPNVKATLLDLETPIRIAHGIAKEKGVTDRVEFIATDAMSYVTDEAYDAILVSNKLHMLGIEASLVLLRRRYNMLVPSGKIQVQAQYLDDSRTYPGGQRCSI